MNGKVFKTCSCIRTLNESDGVNHELVTGYDWLSGCSAGLERRAKRVCVTASNSTSARRPGRLQSSSHKSQASDAIFPACTVHAHPTCVEALLGPAVVSSSHSAPFCQVTPTSRDSSGRHMGNKRSAKLPLRAAVSTV